MMVKEKIKEKLDSLNGKQLQEVEHYIKFITFRKKVLFPLINKTKFRKLYGKYADEDKKIAEEGINEYYVMLKMEDKF